MKFDGTLYVLRGGRVVHSERLRADVAEARELACARLQQSIGDAAEFWVSSVRMLRINRDEADGAQGTRAAQA